MISEAKNVLEAVVQSVGVTHIARTALAEKKLLNNRQIPCVGLITNPGDFDDRQAKQARYFDEEAGIWRQRYIRGKRRVPILVRVWAADEAAADDILSQIIPNIPRSWELDDLGGEITIGTEEHSDYASNVASLYLSVVEVEMAVEVAAAPVDIPTAESTEITGTEYA